LLKAIGLDNGLQCIYAAKHIYHLRDTNFVTRHGGSIAILRLEMRMGSSPSGVGWRDHASNQV
jgi:hypothetical protein